MRVRRSAEREAWAVQPHLGSAVATGQRCHNWAPRREQRLRAQPWLPPAVLGGANLLKVDGWTAFPWRRHRVWSSDTGVLRLSSLVVLRWSFTEPARRSFGLVRCLSNPKSTLRSGEVRVNAAGAWAGDNEELRRRTFSPGRRWNNVGAGGPSAQPGRAGPGCRSWTRSGAGVVLETAKPGWALGISLPIASLPYQFTRHDWQLCLVIYLIMVIFLTGFLVIF